MSKSTRNSGKLKQDQVLNQFKRDAKANYNNSAVMNCLRDGKKYLYKKEDDGVKFSPRELCRKDGK